MLSCVSGELVQSMGSSSSSFSWPSNRGSMDSGRPESLPSLVPFSSPNSPSFSLSPFVSLFTESTSHRDSSCVRAVFGVDVRSGGGVHGSEWQRLCFLGWSPQLVSEGSSQSGGGGRVKVREMTDLLGVSNSLILPPLRSSLWEKGLTRAGVAELTQGGVSWGWSMSDLLRERRGSDGRQRERRRRESMAGQKALKEKK